MEKYKSYYELQKIEEHPRKEMIDTILISEAAEIGDISDGYHTFNELYEHRITLYIALCRKITMLLPDNKSSNIWRSRTMSDGSVWGGWFLLGIGKEPGDQITYHLPESKWELCDFADTLDKAPEFDGHTSADVLKRLSEL